MNIEWNYTSETEEVNQFVLLWLAIHIKNEFDTKFVDIGFYDKRTNTFKSQTNDEIYKKSDVYAWAKVIKPNLP